MKLTETNAEFSRRIRDGGARKPARSLLELSSEVGLSWQALRSLLRARNGPKPTLRLRSGTNGSVWYEYESFCKWWDSLPPEVKP